MARARYITKQAALEELVYYTGRKVLDL